jgi:hypothetical protein
VIAAVVYALAGAGFLGIAHRACRRLSLALALALLLLPLAFTGKALLTGRTLGPLDIAFQAPPLQALAERFGVAHHNAALSDVHCQFQPWRAAVRWAWQHGEWPLLNPFSLCGDLLAPSAQSGPYWPVNLVALLAPAADTLALTASLQLLCAALFMVLFLRDLGCRESAAFLGAVGWAFSDFQIFWMGGGALAQATAVLPLVLLAVRRLVAAPAARAAVGLAASLTLCVLPGHPETLAHVVLIGVLYGAWQLWGIGWRRAGRAVASAVAGGLLALALTAVYLLPVVDALDQSAEQELRRGFYAHLDRSVEWSELGAHLLPSFLPFRNGRPGWGLPPGAAREMDVVAAYAGSLLLPLAAIGLLRSRARERWLLFLLGLLGLLASAAAPGVADLLSQLPPFDIAINQRLGFAWVFAISALAALGAEAFAAGEVRPRRMWMAVAIAGLGASALVVVAMPAVGEGRLSVAEFWRFSSCFLLPLAAAAMAIRWRSRARVLVALAALLLGQRVLEAGNVYASFPRAAFYPRPPILAALPVTSEPYRVVGLGYNLIPNSSAMWGLEDPRGYQAVTLKRFAEVRPLWSVPLPVWFNRVDDQANPLISFLNVRYAIGGPMDWRHRGWIERYRGEDAVLYENPRVLPRAFVPERVRLGASGAQALQELAAATDFRRRSWIELPEDGSARPRPRDVSVRNGSGRVRTEARGSGYVLHASLQARAWVVMSVTAWRGWHAVLETGEELPLAFGNHAFLAFRVPAGEHQVRVFFQPASFVWGRAISLVTLSLLVLRAVYGAWRRRSQERSTSMASP